MKGTAAALSAESAAAGGGAGTAAGAGFASKFAAAMKGPAGPVLVAAAAATGMFAIGKSFDSAFDTIRVKTGDTGQSLEGLKDSFKNVIRDVPTDWGDAAQVIGDVNARLGLTGKPLEDVSAKILELTRLTGGDLASNTTGITRLFGDWSVASEDQSTTLDKLFRATQAGGISIGDLTGFMVQFGAPLRQIGFDFDSSAALFSKFQKEGVNIQTLMPGLRLALKNFAKDGREPAQAFRETVEAIKTLPPEQAKLLAAQVFGTRAATDWVSAIKEGRLELGPMKDAIVNGSDTIRKAGKDTEDFSEKWKKFSSTLAVAVEPVATAVFEGIGNLMDWLGPKIEQFVNWLKSVDWGGIWDGLMNAIAPVIDWLVNVAWPAIQSFVEGVVHAFQSIAEGVSDRWNAIKEAIGNVLIVIGAIIAAFIVGILFLWDTFGEALKNQAQAIWDFIVSIVQSAIDFLIGIIDLGLAILTGDWSAAWEAIKEIFQALWDGLIAIVTLAWNTIISWLMAGLAALQVLWSVAWEAIKAVAQAVWDAILALISFAWEAIKAVIGAAIAFVMFVLAAGWSAIQSAAEAAWNAIAALISFVWEFIKGLVGAAIAFVEFVISAGWNAITSATSAAWDAVVNFISNAWESAKSIIGAALAAIGFAIIAGFNAVVDFVSGVPGKIVDALGNLGSLLFDAGAALMKGLLDGIVSAAQGVIDFVASIPGRITSAFGGNATIGVIRGVLPPSGGGASAPPHQGFAFGGRPSLDWPSIVGERGPELFWPDRAGTIIPNNKLGSGQSSWASDGEALAVLNAMERRLANIERNQNSSPRKRPSAAIVGARS